MIQRGRHEYQLANHRQIIVGKSPSWTSEYPRTASRRPGISKGIHIVTSTHSEKLIGNPNEYRRKHGEQERGRSGASTAATLSGAITGAMANQSIGSGPTPDMPHHGFTTPGMHKVGSGRLRSRSAFTAWGGTRRRCLSVLDRNVSRPAKCV